MTEPHPVTVTRTVSVAATQALAAAVAELALPGDVIVLAGELGAGKTAFAQGFGAALGVDEPIVSPTFTIARQYAGRLPLHHLDVYRLEHLHEALDLGLGEALDDGSVVLVEWGDAIVGVLGTSYLDVRITFGESDDDRVLTLRAVGGGWAARTGALTEALAPWCAGDQAGPPC